MSEDVASLTLEMLRRIDRRLDGMENDLHDIKLRTTVVEEHLGNIVASVGGVNRRIDRLDERMARVERRLDLTDAH